MRGFAHWIAFVSASVLAAAAAAVNPVRPGAGATPSAPSQADAEYAAILTSVLAKIEEDYVWPVPRATLAEAALEGLYEAVRVPLPATYRQELRTADDVRIEQLLARARAEVGDHEAVRGHRAQIASLSALPRVLDPYSGLALATDRTAEVYGTDFFGTGIEFATVPALTVRSGGPESSIQVERPGPGSPVPIRVVLPGSPAQRVGLLPGDVVIRIDGSGPETGAFQVKYAAIQGNRRVSIPEQRVMTGSAVRVTVVRDGVAKPLDFRVAPSVFRSEAIYGVTRRPDDSWSYWIDRENRLAYVRLGAIGYDAHMHFEEVLRSLIDESARGMVLDLRWCPVGFLVQSASIAQNFLRPELPVATRRERNSPPETLTGAPTVRCTDMPLVVLVNGETRGAAELIAAALQDHGRAVIVGQRTVGKASIQTVPRGLQTTNALEFRITTGIFTRPSGKNLQRKPASAAADDWGVRPDAGREFPLSADLSARLKDWHARFILRPAASREAQPLDDPEADPQRWAAVQVLREAIQKH